MKIKSLLSLAVLLASTLACGLPSAATTEPTVIALPPTPDIPFAAAPTSQPSPAQSDTPQSVFNVSLPASDCWVGTNVTLTAGQVINITASGTINTWNENPISFNDPNGQAQNICVEANCPLPGSGYGTLVGRLGDLQPFRVGTAVEFTAQKDGELFFTVNDWECSDNSGTFELVVTIK